jgi:hypothetical protein
VQMGKNGAYPLREFAVCAGGMKWLRLMIVGRHGRSADPYEEK